mgnify:CR=1 FL=1
MYSPHHHTHARARRLPAQAECHRLSACRAAQRTITKFEDRQASQPKSADDEKEKALLKKVQKAKHFLEGSSDIQNYYRTSHYPLVLDFKPFQDAPPTVSLADDESMVAPIPFVMGGLSFGTGKVHEGSVTKWPVAGLKPSYAVRVSMAVFDCPKQCDIADGILAATCIPYSRHSSDKILMPKYLPLTDFDPSEFMNDIDGKLGLYCIHMANWFVTAMDSVLALHDRGIFGVTIDMLSMEHTYGENGYDVVISGENLMLGRGLSDKEADAQEFKKTGCRTLITELLKKFMDFIQLDDGEILYKPIDWATNLLKKKEELRYPTDVILLFEYSIWDCQRAANAKRNIPSPAMLANEDSVYFAPMRRVKHNLEGFMDGRVFSFTDKAVDRMPHAYALADTHEDAMNDAAIKEAFTNAMGFTCESTLLENKNSNSADYPMIKRFITHHKLKKKTMIRILETLSKRMNDILEKFSTVAMPDADHQFAFDIDDRARFHWTRCTRPLRGPRRKDESEHAPNHSLPSLQSAVAFRKGILMCDSAVESLSALP